MKDILIPAAAMGAVGLALGALLAAASKIFAVKKDERAEKIAQCLPGANCGGCGFAGCGAYAEAVAAGNADVDACVAGGQSSADKIAEIMGVATKAVEKKRAVVLCAGNTQTAAQKYFYNGDKSCIAAVKLPGGGHKECGYGCLGFGECAAVCKEGAITVKDGLAYIDGEKCIGCGECVKACPKNLIELVPVKNKIVVKCKSCDKGASTRNKCESGCIGCKICEKNCPSGAIVVENNRATINYEKCSGCGLCAEKCPRKIIIK